jgi:hypothetical protein
MTMTYHENYGDVTVKQLAVYKANNVSPSDHDYLTESFGEDAEEIIKYVLANSPNNNFRIVWGN